MTQDDRRTLDPTRALSACVAAGLSDAAIARATGATPDDVRSWVERDTAPSGEQAERLESMASLVGRLERVVQRAAIGPWLATPIPALGGATPLDRLAAGEQWAVARLISGIQDPGAS